MHPKPSFVYEKEFWRQGINQVIGMDEVGRGALAGPIVVGAVWFSVNFDQQPGLNELTQVNDSKIVGKNLRRHLAPLIKKHCTRWGIGRVPADIIDKIGITRALGLATEQALRYCQRSSSIPFHVLSDAQLLQPDLFHPHVTAIKKGDRLSFSIAAASILAKVWRDQYMTHLSRQPRLRVFKWHQNAGYGTAYHQFCLQRYHPTFYHRQTYLHL